MNRIVSWCLVSLLLAPLAALHAADTPTSVNPFTLAERNGRTCLLSPEGKPFMMLGISHVGGALGKNAGEDRNAHFLYPVVRYKVGKDNKADDLYPDVKNDRSPNVAIREGKWKLLVSADGGGAELYDIAADPKETTNLAGKEPATAQRLADKALAWRKSMP